MQKCPICYCEIKEKDGHHLKSCAIKNDFKFSNLDELRFKKCEYNYPIISKKDKFYLEYIINQKSSIKISKEFNIPKSNVFFLVKFFKFKVRNCSEARKIADLEIKETLISRYGVDNCSKSDKIKEKKKKTFLKNYNVDNIFKIKDFKSIYEEAILSKYNISIDEIRSSSLKKMWNSRTPEQKIEFLEKSLWSKNPTRKAVNQSKLEKIVIKSLVDLNYEIDTSFFIQRDKKHWYFYDVFIKQLNVLVEVNGDFYHANPRKYSSSDVIKYLYGDRTAEEIWKKDKKKKEFAEMHGYSVCYIWEDEIKRNKFNLLKFIKSKLEMFEK